MDRHAKEQNSAIFIDDLIFLCWTTGRVWRRRDNPSSFLLNKHSFHPLTSGRVQIPAGSHLRHRHAEQHAPARPIPSQTKSEAPWSTHVERRSQTVMDQPTQTASSTLSDTTSCRVAPGSDSGRPLVSPCLSGYITVILALCGLSLTLMKMYGDILSHMKRIILTRLESVHPYLSRTYKQCCPWIWYVNPDDLRCTSGKLLGLQLYSASSQGSMTASMAQHPQV